MPAGDYQRANVPTQTYSEQMRDKGHPMVLRVWDEFERAIFYDQKNRERNRENWNLYWGVDNGQWPKKVQVDMTAEDRLMQSYNICTQKVDSLAGAILKNPLEMDFIPVEGGESALTLAVKQAQLSDKELMDWEVSKEDVVIGGLIYEGIEEMYISNKYHPLGNIAFRSLLPGHLVWDPNWQTSSVWDCIKCWKKSYLSPKQMVAIWPKLKERLEHYININKVWGDNYGANDGVLPQFDQVTQHGNRYQVVEQFEMIDEEVEVEYDKMTGLDLPETEDLTAKIRFLNDTNPYWTPESLGKRTKIKRVCYVTTICPDMGLDLILEHKKCEIQIERLPFFTWSAARKHGEVRGIVDLIKDAQYNINYREALITYMLQTQASGSELVDPQLFNDRNKLDDYIANKNNPGRVFETAAGALSRGLAPVKPARAEFPNDVVAQLQRMWDITDRISKAPAVSDARTEGSGESGYLFAQKTALAEQQQYVLFSGLKRYENEKGEAYLAQSKRQYSLGGVKREFVFNNGKNKITLNNRVTYPNGQVGIEHDISQLARHKVIVTESPGGITNRLTTRALAIEIMNTLPPEKTGTRTILSNTLVSTVDQLSEDDKDALKEMQVLELEAAKESLLTSISKMKAERLNADMQIQQIEMAQKAAQAPPPVPTGVPVPGPGPGAPPETAPPQLGPEMATPPGHEMAPMPV